MAQPVNQIEQRPGPISDNPAGPALGLTERFARRLGRATTVMVVLTLMASAINYGSNLIFSHLMSTAQYGDFTALIAFALIAAVPTGAAQTVVAQRVAVLLASGNPDRVRYLIRHAIAHVVSIAIVVGIVYGACIPLVKSALGLQAIGPALALGPLLVLSLFVPVACGVLQGMERFVTLGILLLAIASSRLAFGIPWTLIAGGGAGGPLFGQALGTVVALGVTAWVTRDFLLRRGTGAATSGLKRRPDRRTLAAGGAFTAFALISNLDVLLVKLLMSPHAAGVYAALVTIEKIIIFLPSAVAVVMVPSAARARMVNDSSARVLRVAGLLVLGTILVVAVPAALAPRLLLQIMFGHKYVGAAGGVLPIVCAGAALALLYLLVVYTVAVQDRRWVWLLAGGIMAQVSAILALHSSPIEVATVQASVVLGVLLVNELFFHSIVRGERMWARMSREQAH
jgi:O-antigen/teichoic acid export membrane protein